MPARVPKVTPMSRATIEEAAELFVREASPGTLTGQAMLPVHEIAEFRLAELFGVEFHVGQLPLGVEARFEGDTLILSAQVYDELLENKPRPRFTIAHEIGHCALHRQALLLLNDARRAGQVVLYRRESIESYRDPEWQANVFAATALMPRAAVCEIDRTLHRRIRSLLPDRVASKLGVSLDAAKIRVAQLIDDGFIEGI